MGNNIMGTFYSNTFTTGSVTGSEDLMEKVEANLGLGNVIVKKLTYISSGSYAIDINNTGTWSYLWPDADGNYKLSLDGYDVQVSSFRIKETSASGIWLAIIY
jgi:hypothetical protein